MEIHVTRVSAGHEGDYYQVLFENEEGHETRPYLLIQRQFEDIDDDFCYVETHDQDYRGHFRLELVEFSPTRLRIVLEGTRRRTVQVSYTLPETEYQGVAGVIDVIAGMREPF